MFEGHRVFGGIFFLWWVNAGKPTTFFLTLSCSSPVDDLGGWDEGDSEEVTTAPDLLPRPFPEP